MRKTRINWIILAAACGLIAAAQAQEPAPSKPATGSPDGKVWKKVFENLGIGMDGGEKKISACIGCHGIGGYKTAFPEVYSVPKLGGQHAAYIVKALQDYKSGNRSHPTMRAIAAGLSETDMKQIAYYYSNAERK